MEPDNAEILGADRQALEEAPELNPADVQAGGGERPRCRAGGHGGSSKKHSILASHLAARYRGLLAYDDSSATWREYGDPRPGIWGGITPTGVQGRVRRDLDELLPEGYDASVLAGVTLILRGDLAHRCWDADAGLLPVANGVLRLDTLELMPHSPDNRVTWALPYPYYPEAPAPRSILEFLNWAMVGDADLVQLLLAWLAAIVRGRVDLQRFFEALVPVEPGRALSRGSPRPWSATTTRM